MLQLNQSVMRQLLKDFYTLTKVRIVLWDSQFQEMISYPKERIAFCSLIRKNGEIDTRCHVSDRSGCKKSEKQGGLVIYRCHAGLTEAVLPIRDKYGTIGYVFFGQTLLEDAQKPVREELRAAFSEQQFPGIGEAIDSIGIKTKEELHATGTVLQAITSYMLSNQWVMPKRADFIRQLDAYILEHIGSSITVEQLCRDFRMGRTRFYALSSDFLECPIAAYIRKKRIEEAQRLLRETTLSIARIADATGFSNYNHFFRVFREETGLSARVYRQQH